MTAESSAVNIYALRDPETQQIRYVGQTQYTLDARLREHLWSSYNPERVAWIEQLQSAGKRPIIELLTVTDAESARDVEAAFIQRHLAAGCDLVNVAHVPGSRRRRGIRPPAPKRHGRSTEVELPLSLLGQLKSVARREYRTLSNLMVVLLIEALRARGERVPNDERRDNEQ
jgi:hypothetical protein